MLDSLRLLPIQNVREVTGTLKTRTSKMPRNAAGKKTGTQPLKDSKVSSLDSFSNVNGNRFSIPENVSIVFYSVVSNRLNVSLNHCNCFQVLSRSPLDNSPS